MIKIGLTGGICSGKSFVLSLFEQVGAYTIKADEISKSILFGDNPLVKKEIADKIGLPISSGSDLDYKNFAEIIFADPEKRLLINRIVHPRVKEIRNGIISDVEKSKKYQLLIYESALLVEAGTYRDFDRVVVVYCNRETQVERLMDRDKITRLEAEKKIKSQLPLPEKLKIAHYTVDTSGSMDNTYAMTLEIISLIQRDFNLKLDLIK